MYDPIDQGSPLLVIPALEASSPTICLPFVPPKDMPSTSSSNMGEKRSDRWLPCSATADHIVELADDIRLPPEHGLISCLGEVSPSVEEGESLILLDHISCGISFPLSQFVVDVLNHFNIQLYHLSPNSISYLAIFAHLCRSRLGEEPILYLFLHYYQLKVSNSKKT